MRTTHTLHDVMNDVASQLQNVLSAPLAPAAAFSELEAFACHDGLLADLHKQYLDAKDHHRRAAKEFGTKDGMTEMAMLLEDSAWCAMQTRYMELRSQRPLMTKVQAMMEEQAAAEQKTLKSQKEKETSYQAGMVHLLHRARQKQNDDAALALFFYWIVGLYPNDMFRLPQSYAFNRLAA